MRAVFPAELVVYESAVDSLWQMGGMGQYIYVHVVDAEQAVAEGAGAMHAAARCSQPAAINRPWQMHCAPLSTAANAAPFFKYNNELKEALYGHDYHRVNRPDLCALPW